MSFLGSMLGNRGGMGFRASGTTVAEPVTEKMANTAYKQTQSGLSQQQQFINALAAQNGIGNQQAVFQQLQGVANGTGPNPAQAMLNQATGQNVANQAALMAGQRGAGANVGLLARQAAMQGAGIQQNAAGQSAAMQANQSLNALGQMQNLATNQVGQQQNALAGYNQFAQGQQQNILGGIANQNQSNVAMQSNLNNANSAIQGKVADAQAGMLNGVGAAFSGPAGKLIGKLFAEGGMVPGHAPVPGDSPANDIVPARLSPGEIVIPREVLSAPDPVAAAAHFVHQTLKGGDKKAGNFATGGQQASVEEILAAQGGPAPIAAPLAAPAIQPGSEFQAAPAAMPAPSMAVQPELQPGLMGDVGSMEKGFKTQRQGMAQIANAQSKGAKEEAAIAGQAAADLQMLGKTQEKERLDLDQERKRLVDDVANQKIDPDRFMASLSTGQKIGNAIGLILSGIGSGVTGQPNMAMNFIQKQIDADIDAQKAELGKKESLLNRNLQQFGNLKDAQIMTKANMLDVASMKMKQQAAAIQDPIAQGRLKEEAGKLDIQAAQILGPLRFKQELLKGVDSSSDPIKLVQIVPKEQQAKVVEEIEAAKNFTNVQRKILSTFDKVAKENKILSKSSLPFMPDVPSKAAWRTLGISALKAAGSGALSDKEAELWDSMAKQKGDTDADVARKKQGVIEFLQQKKAGMGSTAKANGIDLSKFESTSGERLTSKEREYLSWAEANPTDPRAIALKKKLGVE